jgi:hypothetical protein
MGILRHAEPIMDLAIPIPRMATIGSVQVPRIHGNGWYSKLWQTFDAITTTLGIRMRAAATRKENHQQHGPHPYAHFEAACKIHYIYIYIYIFLSLYL